MDCIFCKIVNKELSSDILYEDDKVLVFRDLEPVAPIHFLAIPKIHISGANVLDRTNSDVVAHIFNVVSDNYKQWGLIDGFRVVNNCGKNGGQTVMHIHFHIIGGRELSWPPG